MQPKQPTQPEEKSLMNSKLLAVAVLFVVAAVSQADVIFEDNFTGTTGAPWNVALWTKTYAMAPMAATIDDNTGMLKSSGAQYSRAGMTTNIGADFLAEGAQIKYSWDVTQIYGYYEYDYFFAGADGDGNGGVVVRHSASDTDILAIDGSVVWSGNVSMIGYGEILLTPTTYKVILPNGASPLTLTGTHSLAITNGGKLQVRYADELGDAGYLLKVDNVKIESMIPEPLTLVMLGLGMLGLVIRRRK